MRSLRPLLPLLALLAGCGENPKQYLVTGVRILAIRDWVTGTTYADADLGQQVSVEALVASTVSSPATVDWYACAPVVAPLPPCVDPAWLQRPDDLPGAPGVFSLGQGTSVTIDLAAFQALLQPAADEMLKTAAGDPALQCRLYAEVPLVAIARAGSAVQVAVKRVRLTPTATIAASYPQLATGYVVNHNPAVEEIQLDPTSVDACTGGLSLATPCTGPADCGGATCAPDGYCVALLPAPPAMPGGTRTLCARGDPALMDTYYQCRPDGSRNPIAEELEWQWYLSAGTVANSGFDGNVVGNSIDFEPPSGAFTLWAIARDGRGGTAWIVRNLTGP